MLRYSIFGSIYTNAAYPQNAFISSRISITAIVLTEKRQDSNKKISRKK